mgnify:CR=1 FL=1
MASELASVSALASASVSESESESGWVSPLESGWVSASGSEKGLKSAVLHGNSQSVLYPEMGPTPHCRT